MAVLGRLLVGSQQRVDLADFLSMQSYVASDFKELIKSFVGNRPLILKGFDIVDAPQAIGTNSISIRVAGSVVYDPTSNAGSFFSGLPEGNDLSQPIVLGQELRPGVTNYVYLALSTTGAAQDTRAFWDVDLNGGDGGEFNQTINTEAVLIATAGVSVSGFPQGTIPIAKIDYSTSITQITDCRNLMFRLGTGGTSPDPNARFQFPTLPFADYARSEPPSVINSSTLPNPFQGGDKNIETLKDWMDVVMTKLAELSGTTYWYESTGDLSLLNVFDDSLGSSLKSKGTWKHDEETVGLVTWSEDIIYKKINDLRDIIIRSGSKSLGNEQIMWINMIRNQKINSLDTPVTFISGQPYVNGDVSSFSNLNKGDWIKQKGDDEYLYVRVVGFYELSNGDGSQTLPSAAKSVKLESAYAGISGVSSAVYAKGVYENADVNVSNRNDLTAYDAGGNLYWLATRSDTIQKISAIDIQYRPSTTIDGADGKSAKVTFSIAHDLSNGDRIVISGGTDFDGTYEVEISSITEVTIQTTETGSTSSAEVSWAVVTSAARNANNGNFQLESANHGFASGQKVTIANVTGVNGDYLISVRNDTQFQIPYSGGSLAPIVSNGTATCAKVILKTNLGAVEVVQGETIDINEPDTKNLMSFIGMKSLAETAPIYSVPDSTNNMLDGYANYNSQYNDSLTTRTSRLTAMMADRVQDRGLKILGRLTVRNASSGGNQSLTVDGETLNIVKPGSPSQLLSFSSSYLLAAYKAIVGDIDRNGSATVIPSIVDFNSDFLLQENRIVLLYRLSGTEVYTWDGSKISNSTSWTSNEYDTSQNRNITVFEAVGTRYDGSNIYFLSSTGFVHIKIPGSAYYNRIDVSNFTSGISILDGQSVWCRINRYQNKVFTGSTTSGGDQDTDAAGLLYVTSTENVPTDQDVFVLYSIQGTTLLRHHNADIGNQTVYEEFLTVSGTIASGSTISLPVDSRNGNIQARYIKGSGHLSVFLNGQKLRIGDDYTEYGTAGESQTQITLTREDGLIDGDILCFRMDSKGGIYTIDLGTITSLQDAYGQGRTINIDTGSPVVINDASNGIALEIGGDLDVSGISGSLGLRMETSLSNPLDSSDYGLWINEDGHLIQQIQSLPIDITESIQNLASTLIGGDGIQITGNTISVDLSSTPGLEFDTEKLQVKADPAGAISVGVDGVAVNLETTNPSLEINIDNELGAKVSASGALTKTIDGLSVAVDNTTIQIQSNQLVVTGVSNIVTQFINNTGSNILAGMVVSAGSVANEIVLASATDWNSASKIIGIAYENINTGASGLVLTSGVVTIPGSTLTVGEPVFLSPTSGQISAIPPATYGQAIMVVGVAVTSNSINFKPYALGVAANAYLESYTIPVQYTTTQTITLPTDSRGGGANRYYTVGDAMLTVWLNGQKLKEGIDYNEVGTAKSLSRQINILATSTDPYEIGDVLEFRIERDQATLNALMGLI